MSCLSRNTNSPPKQPYLMVTFEVFIWIYHWADIGENAALHFMTHSIALICKNNYF